MRSGIEMIALNVGKGDATVIRCYDRTYLIDTGRYSARKILVKALEQLGITALDAVFLTHTHNDHAGGLRKLRKIGIPIGEIYASKYHPACDRKEHPAVKNAEKMDMKVKWLSAGREIPIAGDAVFRVVAPISEIRDNENDNSLVLLLDSPDGRVLLTGDMEKKEQTALLRSRADIRCDVLKVPDHGDGDACGEQLIHACGAKIAVISTSTEEKPKTPDPKLLKQLAKYGYASYVTQDSVMGIRIVLKKGAVSAEYMR